MAIHNGQRSEDGSFIADVAVRRQEIDEGLEFVLAHDAELLRRLEDA